MIFRTQQINAIVGDITGNTEKILEAIRVAESDGIGVLVLQELVTCGYPPADLLERSDFRKCVYEANKKIISSTDRTTVIFGTIIENPGNGRPIFNAAITAQNGIQLAVTRKTLLPTYDIFDELRYFEPNDSFDLVEVDGIKLGITICEDIWNQDNEVVFHRYNINPAKILKDAGAQILISISASPFTKAKADVRMKMLRNHALGCDLPIVYSNQVGANTEVIFDGDSMIVNRDGTLAATTQLFQPDYADAEWNFETSTFLSRDAIKDRQLTLDHRIFEALKMGIRDYFYKSKLSPKVVLGLSGGIDSALVAVLAAESLGAENVTAIMMPSTYSSVGSVRDSETLAKNLGIKVEKVEINSLFEQFLSEIHPMFPDTEFGLTEENLQSRIRGIILMALSNKTGAIVLNTGNKSELAVGYCTLYGDTNGGLSVLSDLYKTEVYRLCHWLNEKHFQREVIPVSIFTKAPSAELRPDQKDSDSLPDYAMLDEILKMYIELQSSKEEIMDAGFSKELVNKVIQMTDFSEYKRRQCPPGLRLSSKAFGYGRRLPIVQRWTAGN